MAPDYFNAYGRCDKDRAYRYSKIIQSMSRKGNCRLHYSLQIFVSSDEIKTAVPYFFSWRLFLRNKQFPGHKPTFFCRIPCIQCISHLCTFHFYHGNGFHMHVLMRLYYATKHSRPSYKQLCFSSSCYALTDYSVRREKATASP